MIRLSQRFVPAVCVLLALCSIPTLYHLAVAPRVESCREPRRLVGERFLASVHEFHTLPFVRHFLIDGSVGTLELPGRWNEEPKFRISRTFNLDGYYFEPLDNFTNMFPSDRISLHRIESDGVTLPVHLRLDESETESVMTAYLYILGGRPIRNPFTGSLDHWFDQLLHGRQALTMILINGHTPFEHMEEQRDVMFDWMRDAWKRYDEVCNP